MKNVNEKELVEVLAGVETEIKNISSALSVLSKSNLKIEAIAVLVQMNTKPRLTKEQVLNVLHATKTLANAHFKKIS